MASVVRLNDEQKRRRRNRNIALLAVLGGLSLLFYVLTFVLVGGHR